MTLDDTIRAELDRIYDPCSVAAGRPTSILAMGLVLGWRVARETVALRLTVTNTGCTMFPHFSEAARRAIESLPGIERCTVEVDLEHQWFPEDGALADVPAQRDRLSPPEPQAWRKRMPNTG